MGWASLYIFYVYINSKVAKKMVLSSSCINIKCVVTDFIRHYLKLAFCEEKCRKSWPNLIPIRENGKIVEEHKGFLSGKWLGRHIRGGLFPWPPKIEGYGWLPNTPPLSSVQGGDMSVGRHPRCCSSSDWCQPHETVPPSAEIVTKALLLQEDN